MSDADLLTKVVKIYEKKVWVECDMMGDKQTLPDYGRWVARAVERAHGIKAKPNLCRLCGHEIYSHDRQYGCSEDGCDCDTPNV